MAQDPSTMKQQPKEATIIMENVVETLSKDLERVSFEKLPDVAPVSDTSASSAGSTGCCRSGTDAQQHLRTPSETSEVESEQQVDEKEWLETKATRKDETSSKQSSKASRPHVSWGDVELRFFPMVPGDHPDAQGVPLTIDWTPVKQVRQRIDSFEAKRENQRRHDEDLRLGWLDRRRILRRLGATEEEISEALESSYRVRKQRQQTASWRSKFAKVEELQQSLRRSLGRTFHPKSGLKTKY